MAIPKKYKRQLKSAYSNSRKSSDGSRGKGNSKTWSFKVGDLVRDSKTKLWGVVLSSPTSSGLMSILTSSGKKNWYASNLERVQKLQF